MVNDFQGPNDLLREDLRGRELEIAIQMVWNILLTVLI